jgi:hypothetical protein
VDTGDGPDTVANYTLLKRGKRIDYFTSALPWPQKGASVTLPLGSKALIKTDVPDDSSYLSVLNPSGVKKGISTGGALALLSGTTVTGNGDLYADLSTATASTINQLRQSFQIQKLLERDARGGTRYTEIIRSHFGVVSPDARLQRPEYLGGGSTPININPIAQTSGTGQTGQTTPLGTLGAMGTALAHRHGFSQSFTEHGVMMLSNVLKSKHAIHVSMRIIDVFVILRETLANHAELRLEIEQIKKKLNSHGKNIELVFQYLDELLEKRDNPIPRVQIGFKVPIKK